MEDYKHPSWRIPNGNGLVHPTKSVYDDVFGGPPKFAAAPYMAPTATARVDDYAEIFGGFGGGGGSSIPVLDLPPAVDAVDPRSSALDYDEIFGGFDGGDFGVPYEELFMEVKKERNPVKPNSERASSVKVNGDAVSLPDKNGNQFSTNGDSQFSTNGDSNHLHGSTKQLNMDYHKISRSDEDAMNGTTHIAQLHSVPGYSFVIDGSSDCLTESIAVEPKSNGKAEHLKKDESHSTSSSSRNSRDELKACQDPFSPKSNASSDLSSSDQNQSHHSGSRPTSSRGRSSPTNSFITISDVNLQTQPTRVPPPSRPPPKLPIKWESRAAVNPKVDKSFHVASFSRARPHEEAAKDSSPPFLDVEVDAGSAVAASVAAMKEAMEQAQMRLKSAKESMQRKKDNLHSRKKSFQSEGPKSNDHRAAQEVFPHKQEIAQEVAEEGAYKMNGFSGEQIPETAKEADVSVEFEEKEKSIGISEKQITQRKQPSDPPAKQEYNLTFIQKKILKKNYTNVLQSLSFQRRRQSCALEGGETIL
ncbi:hypothetical protein QJS04_geneDACA005128 [Acorus gramineus]|uniref:Uncharacterized protein n=1 Tax=Acorus gramineus TaxID=55184 RepID=A0AAV9AUG7_ACOGR|nr:hypothetical protein QJS04_geneDACA005128 [Acorus gramineus]